MKLNIVRPQEIDAKVIEVHVKVCDSGCYSLIGADGAKIAELEQEYVPGFFPEEHYGDYLDFKIDLETGQILNWKKPDPKDVAEAFHLTGNEE